MLRLVVVILALQLTAADYFKYSDCDQNCQEKNVSCTIDEISPGFFISECFDSETACELHYSSTVVCLRPDKEPLGGSKIWNDWVNNHRTTTAAPSTTTTHAPNPVPGKGGLGWPMVTLLVLGAPLLIVCVFWTIKRFSRRAGYEGLIPGPRSERRELSFSELGRVYERTTEDL